jgi:DnaJ-class molecular chaperone
MLSLRVENSQVALDDSCDECGGSGYFAEGENEVACGACDGAGRHMTENGVALMLFLQRWSTPS